MRGAVRPLHTWVWLGILAGLGWTAARVAIPFLTGQAIDEGIVPGNFEVALEWMGIILAVGVIQAICTGLRRYAAFRLAYRVETNLRMRLVAHLQQLHFAFHDHAQTGQLMANANTDIQQIQQVVLLIPLTIASVLTMVAVVIVLVLQSPGLALFALATLPLLNIAATRFTRRMYPVGLSLQQELADLSGVVEESVAGVRVVKGFGAERLQERNLAVEADDVYDRSIDQARLRANFLPLIDLLPTLGLVGILWYGGHQVIAGNLTIGDIVAANFYVLMLIWPLRMVGMLLGQLSRAAASAGRIDTVLATDPAIEDDPGAAPLAPGPGAVRFDGVTFGYGRVRPVLDGLDLEIRGGEAIALVGATASGKTTVARLIPRFYDVSGGRICIDGHDVRETRLNEVRRAVGLVFEDTFLFSDTVRSNIAFADPEATMEQVVRAARLAGADEFVRELPDGLRHHHRRARLLALGWPASAHRDRARGARRPAHPDPRRRDVVGRPEQGARDPQRAARSDAGPHDDHHRPPPGDDRARRPRRAAHDGRSSPTARTKGCSRRTRATAKCSRAPKPKNCARATTKATTRTCRPSSAR